MKKENEDFMSMVNIIDRFLADELKRPPADMVDIEDRALFRVTNHVRAVRKLARYLVKNYTKK